MYDRTSECLEVNEVRKQLFTQKSRSLENVPLTTKAALEQHLKRASYQAHCWSHWLKILSCQVHLTLVGSVKEEGGSLYGQTLLWLLNHVVNLSAAAAKEVNLGVKSRLKCAALLTLTRVKETVQVRSSGAKSNGTL